MSDELVLATRNAHKVQEFTRLLAPYGITVVPLPEGIRLPPEDGDTFAANALPKAQAAAEALGRPALADDSGIEAEALDGRPGVRSARFAGEQASDAENLAKLLAEVPEGSGLRYVCVVAYCEAGGDPHRLFEGTCRGRLTGRPRGLGGFGYDPAFMPHDDPPQRTMAELAPEEKDAISHRGQAVREFARWYRER